MIKAPNNKKVIKNGVNINIDWNINEFTDINLRLKRMLKRVAEFSKDKMNEEYVPKQTGNLIDSVQVEEFSNKVNIKWTAPYATKVYYDKTEKLDGKRGPYWFDRMFDYYRLYIEKEANTAYKRGE